MDLNEPILPARDETPTKYVSFEENITIRCMLQYIDFEGLTDGRSIRNILARIAPRKLVCWISVGKLMFTLTCLLTLDLSDHCTWHAPGNKPAVCFTEEHWPVHEWYIYARCWRGSQCICLHQHLPSQTHWRSRQCFTILQGKEIEVY